MKTTDEQRTHSLAVAGNSSEGDYAVFVFQGAKACSVSVDSNKMYRVVIK